MTRNELRVRPLTLADEAEARAAHAEMLGWDFLLHLADADSFAGYISLLDARSRGERLTGRLVPSTFLVAEVDGTLVGRVSIRHELNDFLAQWGGHVGYGVRPAFRRRGHATEILRQALGVARAAGVERVLVTCDDDNIGSARVIEICGGVLENVVPGEEGSPTPKRRYWIDPVRPRGHPLRPANGVL